SVFLRDECAGDEELRHEVESLLKYESGAEQLMEVSAMQMAARSLAQENLRVLEGRQIGPYKILSLIGRGGMGEVYLAHDTKLSRDVAIKVLPNAVSNDAERLPLPAAFASDVERLTRFRREAQLLASLNHPNIAHVYGIEEFDQAHCIVMEFIEGETLQMR